MGRGDGLLLAFLFVVLPNAVAAAIVIAVDRATSLLGTVTPTWYSSPMTSRGRTSRSRKCLGPSSSRSVLGAASCSRGIYLCVFCLVSFYRVRRPFVMRDFFFEVANRVVFVFKLVVAP